MRERPILFSGEMVRAILAGDKRVTRRVVKPQPPEYIDRLHGSELSRRAPYTFTHPETGADWGWGFIDDNDVPYRCPYGRPGDRLWVRETWQQIGELGPERWTFEVPTEGEGRLLYAADIDEEEPPKWRPSIHMPRWASRLTLTVKGVRVERLKDISEADAEAEGCSESVFPAMVSIMTKGGGVVEVSPDYIHGIPAVGDELLGKEVVHVERSDPQVTSTARDNFIGLWNRINYGRGFSWDSNPWVWVVEFEPAAPAAGQEDEK